MNHKETPAPFESFPELETEIPRIPIGDFPTPVHELKQIGNGRLWIKRDDLTAKEYGGNKVRKLEYILGHVRSLNKNHIVTMGGIGTNHGLATTIYAGKMGIKTTLILFPQPPNDAVRHNMLLFHKYGAELIYTPSMFKLGLHYTIFQRLKTPRAYFLFAGGSSPQGSLGFVNAAFELKQQIDIKELPRPGMVVCPLGSNGTLAGLSLGMQLSGLDIPVIGVRVTKENLGPLQVAGEKAVRSLMKNTLRLLQNMSPRVPEISIKTPRILHNYFGECYGCETKKGMAAIDIMKESNNIQLDLTYTGKTFAAVLDLVNDTSTGNKPILYWNTYNSADLTNHWKDIDYKVLPEELHQYF